MAQRCKKCGTFLMDTDRFCPNCGENVPPPEQPQTVYQAPPVPQSGMGMPPPPVSPVPPSYSVRPAFEEEMPLSKWVLTLFVTNLLGLIGWIFLFIWGFGSAGPESRRRYCKAMLIVKAVGTVVAILFFVVYASALFAGLAGYAEYGDYTRAAAAVFPRFLG